MEFLDQTVQKAKEIFEIAYQKTGDAVNTGKQKLEIASLENKLNKEYRLLGKLYYNAYKSGEEVDLDNIIQNIDAIKKQIKLKKEELEMDK